MVWKQIKKIHVRKSARGFVVFFLNFFFNESPTSETSREADN